MEMLSQREFKVLSSELEIMDKQWETAVQDKDS